MIVNGTEHVVGAKPMRLADALMRQREPPRGLRLISRGRGAG
jgi:hypothetical protein